MACESCDMPTNGCGHYTNHVKIQSPCCKKKYSCKVCHNEQEDHDLESAFIEELICRKCSRIQNVGQSCKYCLVQFGEYSCVDCKIFDTFKNQYHCNECGICRLGPEVSFFHCIKCNLCLNNVLKHNHKCVENVSRDNCSVCMEDLHSSRICLKLLICRHFLHEKCYEDLLSANKDFCPICRSSLVLKPLDGDAPVYSVPLPS